MATRGGKVCNYKAIKTKAKKNKKNKKKFKLRAKALKQSKKLKVKKHRKLKYLSTNKKVATVTAKGVIKAKKKGKCSVYVYAQSGIYKRIKVIVR